MSLWFVAANHDLNMIGYSIYPIRIFQQSIIHIVNVYIFLKHKESAYTNRNV